METFIAFTLTDNDFITAIAALVFWVGGYAAAPVIFMATLGVFKNIAGMGTGMMKQARGKMTDRAGSRFKTDKGLYNQERDQKREYAALRAKHNFRQRREAGVRGTLRGEADTIGRPSKGDWRRAQSAVIGSQLIKSDPKIKAGVAASEATDARNNAASYTAAANLANSIDLHIGKVVTTEDINGSVKLQNMVREGNLSVGGKLNNAQARSYALEKEKKRIISTAETMEDHEFVGAMNALGTQQAGGELMEIQETMNTTTKAKKFSAALNHGDTYGKMTALNAALGKAGVGEGLVPANLKIARARSNLGEKPAKLTKMAGAAWQEMLDYDRTATQQKIREIQNLGGEPASNLDLPNGWNT